jgi:hypothetical protein
VYTDPDGRTYTVCDPNGKNCVDYNDSEFEKLRKGGPADGYTFKNGNIYYKGELTGTYTNDCLYCGQLVNEMGRRSSAIEQGTLAFAFVAGVGGATGGVGLYYLTPYLAPTVTTLGLGSTSATGAPTALGTAFSQATLRTFQRQLAQHGRAALEKSLRSFEKRLAEHLQKIEEARKAGGYTSSVEKEVKIFRESIAAIKHILGK